jgi:hypothetical protein
MNILERLLLEADAAAEHTRSQAMAEVEVISQKAREAVLASGMKKIEKDYARTLTSLTGQVLESNDAERIARFSKDIEKLVQKYSSEIKVSDVNHNSDELSMYINNNYQPGAKIHVREIVQQTSLSRRTVYEMLKKNRNVEKKDRYYHRKFVAKADDLVPIGVKALQEYGYVSAPLLVKMGYGDYTRLKNIGKALRWAAPAIFDGEFDKSRAASSKLKTNYITYHPVGLEPTIVE